MTNIKDENERLRREISKVRHPNIQKARLRAENIKLRLELERAKGPVARVGRRRAEIRATGGFRGIVGRQGQQIETVGRQRLGKESKRAVKLLGKEAKKFFSLHSNPHGFSKMIMRNPKMSQSEKKKALKTYIKNHKR